MTTRRPNSLRLLALALCLLAAALAPSQAAAAKTGAKAPRSHNHGLYWGAWIGDQITGEAAPWDMGAVNRFSRAVGKRLSVVAFAAPLAECDGGSCEFPSFPTDPMQTIRDYGAIPLLSWSTSATPTYVDAPDFQLSDVIAGRYDAYIHRFASEAASWGRPFFLRFNWEMNGNWFPWAEGVNGNRSGQFVNAWRHVHRIFDAAGASNATWVWCPYANTRGRYGNLASYYPGNRYVDWTCLDGYNFAGSPVNPRPWQRFDALFRPAYRVLTTKIARRKPVLLGEIASAGAPRRKAVWIREMFNRLPHRYPRIGGLVWFDQFDRGLRWPIEIDGPARKAFRSGLRGGRFLGSRFSRLSATPIPMPR